MANRRKFIQQTALGAAAMVASSIGCAANEPGSNLGTEKDSKVASKGKAPIVVSTWNNEKANAAAMKVLAKGGKAIDAVEAGARVPEADPDDNSVGYGGRPDREGVVTLDACIMDHHGNCGSVSFLQDIMHPISVARKVMEKTPHVMLSGRGALEFALAEGFKKEKLLTEKSKQEWLEWKKDSSYKPIINIENHDTIGMVGVDKDGDIAGACTTSGMAYKMHGRVGDSPIIGAGMFADNEVGAACATGVGEAVIKICGSFLVVELMRQGASPQEACEEAIKRIAGKQNFKDIQVGFLAIDKSGNYGAYALQKGFVYIVDTEDSSELFDSGYINK